ncbi:MAG: tyrosine-type recombinase/integrase [Yoonia sp.]
MLSKERHQTATGPDIIDQTATGAETYLVTEYGKPFSIKGLGNKFRDWCDEAGLPQRCSMHGLRKAGAVAMAESGSTPHDIMAVTGHRTLSEVQRYTEEAKRTKLAKQEFERRALERKKVPLPNGEDKSGTNPDLEPLENNAFREPMAVPRGIEPLFPG